MNNYSYANKLDTLEEIDKCLEKATYEMRKYICKPSI